MPRVDLAPVFTTLKTALAKYASKLEVHHDTSAGYELCSKKRDIEVNGHELETLFYAAIRLGKSDVTLYFYPIYTHSDAFGDVAPPLGKARKGKSCFGFKKPLDAKAEKQLAAMLKKGFDLYKKEKLV